MRGIGNREGDKNKKYPTSGTLRGSVMIRSTAVEELLARLRRRRQRWLGNAFALELPLLEPTRPLKELPYPAIL